MQVVPNGQCCFEAGQCWSMLRLAGPLIAPHLPNIARCSVLCLALMWGARCLMLTFVHGTTAQHDWSTHAHHLTPHTSHCTALQARVFEKDMHGGFNEDPETGLIYTGIPGFGLVQISHDLKIWWVTVSPRLMQWECGHCTPTSTAHHPKHTHTQPRAPAVITTLPAHTTRPVCPFIALSVVCTLPTHLLSHSPLAANPHICSLTPLSLQMRTRAHARMLMTNPHSYFLVFTRRRRHAGLALATTSVSRVTSTASCSSFTRESSTSLLLKTQRNAFLCSV
jgi:hypothetical protein